MSMMRELGRRIRNHLAFGQTTGQVRLGNDGLPVVQVQLASLELMELRIVEQRGVASNLPVGTPVTAQFAGGDRSNGVITGSTSPSTRPALSGDDDVALFGYGFAITIGADGVHITAPVVTISGSLNVMGEVTAKAGTAGSVTLSQHRGHQGGGGPPTPGT